MSAFLKRYFEEHDSDRFDELLRSAPRWITARHTLVEFRRNPAHELGGRDLAEAGRQFRRNWGSAAARDGRPSSGPGRPLVERWDVLGT